MTSLRRRLERVLLVLLAGFAVQWIVSDRMIVWVGESEMATRLQHDADSLAAALALDAGGRLRFDARAIGVIYGQRFSGHYFAIRGGGQHFASASFGETEPFVPKAAAAEALDHVDGPAGQPLLMLSRPLVVGGVPVVLGVAEDLSNMHRQLIEFRLLFLALSLAVFGGTLLLQRREIRVALGPVELARDSVLKLREAGAPVTAVEAPDEIQPLLDEIHRLMAYVERRLQQSRNAIGNLSHAVKTPLTGLFRLLDDPRLVLHPELRQQMRERADAIHARIDRELKRARLAGERPTRNSFDPRAELPALVQLLGQIHGDRNLAIEWQAPEHALSYDREDLMELIGNLADNACKWAAGRVRIELRENAGLHVTVSDDGPGAPPDLLESLLARGQRLDESRPGYGLGLAIVRDIVEFDGGQLELGRSAALGGLEVHAYIPR